MAASSESTSSGARVVSSSHPLRMSSLPKRATSFNLITRPRQRQSWGEKQILPHVDWNDLLWDLFYVAAAYNLSNIILSDPDDIGLLYFVGLFGPVMHSWFIRLRVDAQYVMGSDPFHYTFEVINLCFLATAVLHIRPVDFMSNSKYPDMFFYCLAVTLLQLMKIAKYAELYFRGDGDREAIKKSSKSVLQTLFIQLLFYVGAAIVSGIQYFGNQANDSGGSSYGNDDANRRALFEGSSCSAFTGMLSTFAEQCGLNTRFLAAASTYDYTQDSDSNEFTKHIPVLLCLVGYLYFYLSQFITFFFCVPRQGQHKPSNVPMNIDFAIHRHGEWVMLLLGESILSLLIVETTENLEYYITFFAGIISVVLLQYLHFRSQPHHVNLHAMRRSVRSGISYLTLMQIYSFVLVAVGVSFKMLLYEFFYEEQSEDEYGLRRLIQLMKTVTWRNLAGGVEIKYATEERRQRVANFFCASVALSWTCLDLMILCHRGFNVNVQRCKDTTTGKAKGIRVAIIIFRLVLIAFIATLSQYVQDPMHLALIGMGCIIIQVMIRVGGDFIFPEIESGNEGSLEESSDSDGKDDPVMTAPFRQRFSDGYEEDIYTGPIRDESDDNDKDVTGVGQKTTAFLDGCHSKDSSC